MQKKNKKVQLRVSDVKKMERNAINQASYMALNMFMFTLHNDFGFGKKRLQDVFDKVNELSGDITEGRITFRDLEEVLESETGVIFGVTQC